MPRAYSADLRARVVEAYAAAEVERAEIARRFRISESTVYGWWRQWREEGRQQAWSKLKTRLRSAATRTKEVLENALTALLEEITAADAQGWFAHSGYAATPN